MRPPCLHERTYDGQRTMEQIFCSIKRKRFCFTHKNLEKVLIKIGKLPGLLPRPSESQVRLYYSDERGGSIEGRR